MNAVQNRAGTIHEPALFACMMGFADPDSALDNGKKQPHALIVPFEFDGYFTNLTESSKGSGQVERKGSKSNQVKSRLSPSSPLK